MNNYSYTFIYVIFTLDYYLVYICIIYIVKPAKLIISPILGKFTDVRLQN